MRLGLNKQMDQLVEHSLRIEIFLWLINHERSVVAVVEGKPIRLGNVSPPQPLWTS